MYPELSQHIPITAHLTKLLDYASRILRTPMRHTSLEFTSCHVDLLTITKLIGRIGS